MESTVDFSHYLKSAGTGLLHLDLAVEGINCAGCMAKIERNLSKIPDVTSARVNLTDRRLALEWKAGAVDPALFVDRLAELGYKAYPFEAAGAETREAERASALLRRLGVAAFAAMNVMMLSVPVWSGNVSDMLPEQRDFFHWLSALIVLPAAAYSAQPFFSSAWTALRARGVNMDVPISVGIMLALAMSLFETAMHAEHAYFDAAIMLIAFLLAGRYLDQNMRRRTRAFAGNLAALKAETATKFISDDEIRTVPVAAIRPGDIVLLRPGERSAVDGSVISGRSEIDQSLITGETLPATAVAGSAVYAGTLVRSGALRVRVSAASEGTLLSEISRLLDNAVQSRSRYLRLAERASRLYAPLVHATALLTMIGWLIVGATLARFDRDCDRGAHHHLSLRARPRHSRGADGGFRRAVQLRRAAQFGRRNRAHGRGRSGDFRQDRHADPARTRRFQCRLDPRRCFRSRRPRCAVEPPSGRRCGGARGRRNGAAARHRGGAGAGRLRRDRWRGNQARPSVLVWRR